MFCPKSTTQNKLKNTLSVSRSLIMFSLTHVQMAFIGIKYKGSYCRNKSSSCRQHGIVIAAKYHRWADVKNPQTDLIPYLHFKDHSAFKHKIMMHSVIYISSKCVQQKKGHLYSQLFRIYLKVVNFLVGANVCLMSPTSLIDAPNLSPTSAEIPLGK